MPLIARKTKGETTTENMTCRKVTAEKVTVEKEGGEMGKKRREGHVTGGKMKGRKEVKVDVMKGKSITGMITGRKGAGKKGTQKVAGGKVNDKVDEHVKSQVVVCWVHRRQNDIAST